MIKKIDDWWHPEFMKIYVKFEWEGKNNLIQILNSITDEEKEKIVRAVERQNWFKWLSDLRNELNRGGISL